MMRREPESWRGTLIADETADTEPRKAVIVFNYKGEVGCVTKSAGFREAQIDYVITGSGDAHKFAAGAQQLKIREYEADAERRGISTYGSCFADTRVCTLDLYSPVTRNDVKAIVAEACEGLNEDQQMKVQTWLGTILVDVEEKSFKKYGKQSSGLDNSSAAGPLFPPDRPTPGRWFSCSSDQKLTLKD